MCFSILPLSGIAKLSNDMKIKMKKVYNLALADPVWAGQRASKFNKH